MASNSMNLDALQLLTPAEAAKLLAISTIHLHDLAIHGDISYVNVGAGKKRETRRYRLTDIQRFEQDRTLISPIRRSTRAPLEITDEDLLKAAKIVARDRTGSIVKIDIRTLECTIYPMPAGKAVPPDSFPPDGPENFD
ncbi:helix-turn-helix domain-containing protein [Pararhizobium sp. YC-54]|uniref:helix-turn-helix domain-containing protein n=1 Tax=Pararhizobium sp. YC-54 TaxID=2986920 RepID=UPI0021F7EDAE|nr:helix-turn-helix domain-containing protein [Pararhizobium sp. YC-54]MCV9997302.1 helix-turn-helix domain-containing protein [Pararhizobium sp. YC-54]